MLPVDYGYLHNSMYSYLGRYQGLLAFLGPVSLGFMKKTHPHLLTVCVKYDFA